MTDGSDPLRLYLPIIEVFVRLSRLAWLMACACPVHEAHLRYLLRQFDTSAISTITNIRAWNNQKSVLLFFKSRLLLCACSTRRPAGLGTQEEGPDPRFNDQVPGTGSMQTNPTRTPNGTVPSGLPTSTGTQTDVRCLGRENGSRPARNEGDSTSQRCE